MTAVASNLASDLQETPLLLARRYHTGENLWVKLEGEHPSRSIKHRAALFMLDAARMEDGSENPTIVESTSGNLGYALGLLAPRFGYDVLCIVDALMPREKLRLLEGVTRIQMVNARSPNDPRAMRIAKARELGCLPGYRWINQYGSEANYRAHLESTGPELSLQAQEMVRWVVCAVGSGGTACGLAAFFAGRGTRTSVVCVEPFGSTIYGKRAAPYLSVGAGLHEPSQLMRRWDQSVAAHAQVPDGVAISEVKRFRNSEGIDLGITSGACLAVAHQLANAFPEEGVVAISADYGGPYHEIVDAGAILERIPLTITSLKP